MHTPPTPEHGPPFAIPESKRRDDAPPPPTPPREATPPHCYVHPQHFSAGFCNVCQRPVCLPCGLVHQATHARKN